MKTMTDVQKLARNNSVSVWRDAHSRGFIAEVRGVGAYSWAWTRIGVYGTRTAAIAALRAGGHFR